MYVLKPGIKRDNDRFWALPDRIFFGFGACQILAGAYLQERLIDGFWAERIIPKEGYWGNHIFVTEGEIAFDFHGYSKRSRLLEHFCRQWAEKYPGWDCKIERVKFNLLDKTELNSRNMRYRDQYLQDAYPRAVKFLRRFDHQNAFARAARK